MHPKRALWRTGATAAIIAAALAITVVAPVAAFDWGEEVRLSAAPLPLGSRVVATGPDSAVVTWFGSSAAGFGLQMRRTSDGGRTWTQPSLLAGKRAPGYVIAGLGQSLDLVWAELQRCASTGSGLNYQLVYRRSGDGGATWTRSVTLTRNCTDIADATVARSADGQVTVAYTVTYGGRVFTRTSLDGGRSFGEPVRVGRSAQCGGDTAGGRSGPKPCRGEPSLAIGQGVTYVGHTGARNRGLSLEVHASTDRGRSWSRAAELAKFAGPYAIVAHGTDALVGYHDWRDHAAKVRRTADGGKTWEPEQPIQVGPLIGPADRAPPDPEGPVFGPTFTADLRFDYANGVLVATFKGGFPGDSPVWQKQSTDFGLTWSHASRISLDHAAGHDEPVPGGVGLLTRAIAVYEDSRVHGVWVRIQRDAPPSRAMKL